MRVLLDTRPAESCATGIGRYARTLRALLADGGIPGHEGFSLGSDVRLAVRSAVEAELELELELPALLEREAIGVFHSPLFVLPALLPCPAVVTIHDAIPLARPDLASPSFQRLFEEHAAKAAARATLVVCPSEHAKKELVRTLGLDEARVRVVPETPQGCFQVLEPEARASIRRRHALEGPFFLVLGTLEKRKNPRVVLEALAARPDAPPVVFVGPEGGFDLRGESERLGVADRVRSLGTVSDENLVGLLGEALALVFPSLHEGFGLPVVEAFACDTPVIASTAGSLPEVAGDAAIFFDPEDASALGQAMARVQDETVHADLVGRGRARLTRFTPAVVRQALADLYSELERAL